MERINKDVLLTLGWSPLEVDIYVILILKGQLNGNQLAEELRIDRTVVYRNLKNLELTGVIKSTSEKYNRKYYIDDTSKLLSVAENKRDLAQGSYDKVKQFVETLPLLSLEQVLNSKVTVYRGDDSIIKVYQEKDRSGDPLLREISNNLVFPCNALNEEFWLKEIAVRKANKSFLHQLVDKSDDSELFHRTKAEQFKEVRVFPSDFVMSAGINIYKNKIAFHNNSIADPLSLIIEDKAMAELMKTFFDFVWNRSQVI